MSLLRILLGYLTENYREEEPQVLLISRDADRVQPTVAAAGSQFLRIELIESRGGQRVRKELPLVDGEAVRSGSSPLSQAALEEVKEPSVFEGKTIAELQELCDELGVSHKGFRLKAEFVGALELDAELSTHTKAELKAQAEEQGLDVTGLRSKRDFLNLLEGAAKAASGTQLPSPAGSAVASPGGDAAAVPGADADGAADAETQPETTSRRRRS